MKWVNWENIGVDRMACAWLIRKQIDPQAEFVFIPAASTLPVFTLPAAHCMHSCR